MVSEALVHHGGEGMTRQFTSHHADWQAERGDAGAQVAFSLSPFYFIWAPSPWDGATHIKDFHSQLILSGNAFTDTPRDTPQSSR